MLIRAASLPIMYEHWTAQSSGAQVAYLKVFFRLHDPWTAQVPVGVSEVSSDWVLAPVGILGAAFALVVCALLPLTLSKDPEGQDTRLIPAAVCLGWLGVVAFFAVFLLAMTAGATYTDDNPDYDIRSVLMPGGWLILLANGVMAYALQRTRKRTKKLAA